MPAIFISHSSRDQQVADDIKSALARLGFERAFLDFDKDTGIGAGEDWEKRLYEELSRCHAIILMLTPNWLASKWCFAELTAARFLGKVILPVICAPLGERYVLPGIQAVDLVDWNEGGLERIEQRLHAITAELARGFTLAPDRPPYPGIHAFEAKDAAIYFGRDDETRAAIDRIEACRTRGGARLLLIIGASGAGKSSLLKAGILPQLGRRRDRWIVLPTMRPEKAPLEALAKIVAELRGEPRDWRTWHERLRGPEAVQQFAELVKDLRVETARAATVLLPIDQIEEVFTIAEVEERAAFLRLMAALLDPGRDLPVIAVATGRADVLQGLLENSELAPLTDTLPLPLMPLDRVPRLVEGPAAVASLFLEPGLAERIMRDVETPEALPLLAHTLDLLHQRCARDKRLTLTAYLSLGDPGRGFNPVQNSVRLAADEAIGRLKPTEAELASLRDAFVPHLVRLRLDDGRRVRQPAPLASLPCEAERLIRALTEARLLTVRAGEGEAMVEVAHEALFAAWPVLASWLDGEQAFLADIERIKSAHDAWSEAPEEHKPQALLQGLLLANASDWLAKYPQRFIGRDMERLRGFIAESRDVQEAAERERTRERDEAARRLADRLSEAQLNESRFLTSIAEAELRDGNIERAMLIAREALPSDLRKPDRPIWNGAFVPIAKARERDRAVAVAIGHRNAVNSAAFSPDGARVVTASDDRTARLWDAKTGGLLATLEGHQGTVRSAAFSPDGTRVVTASDDNTARMWHAASGALLATLEGHNAVWSAAFSPDGARIITASPRDLTAQLWDGETGRALATLEGHHGMVWRAAFSPDGGRVVTASMDNTARLWDGTTGAVLAILEGHHDNIWSAVFSADATRIVTASSDRTARLWDGKTGAVLATLEGHTANVSSAAFSPDGARIVTASTDHTARLWDGETGALLATLEGHQHVVHVAAFSADGARVLSASDDRTARLWDGTTGAALATFEGHTDWVRGAAFSPDGTRIVTASSDRTARLWDGNSGAELTILKGHQGRVNSAAFSPDGAQVVTASADHTARLWNGKTGAPIVIFEPVDTVRIVRPAEIEMLLARVKEHGWPVNSAAFSPDGGRVVTTSDDWTARMWDGNSGAELTVLKGHQGRVKSAVFSPDGARVVTASVDDAARLWDGKTGAVLATLGGHRGSSRSAAFSSDGARVVTASLDTAQLWDAASGAALVTLAGHQHDINSAAFSPDGTRVVTASNDGTARLWDATSGALLATLEGHTGRVYSTAFSPDGKRVVTGSGDNTARLWDGTTGAVLAILEGHHGHIWSAAFSPDGTRIVTASSDRTAQLWDGKTGALLSTLEGHQRDVNSAAFSPDGARIVTASSDNTARLWEAWPLPSDDTATYIAIAAMRRLTPEERSRAFLTAAAVGTAEATAEPDRHRQLAEGFERAAGAGRDLERALFHYAVAVRLFEEQGREDEARLARMRRGSLARALPPQTVVRIAYEAMDWRPLGRADE